MATKRDRAAQAHPRIVMRRRLTMGLWSSPVAIALLVVAFWLFSQLLTAQAAMDDFSRGHYESSEEQFESLLDPNIIEPYLPYFNRGDARAGQSAFTPAIDDFERALELAPLDRRCMVRVNLVLSWEALGDEYSAAGLYQGALLLYEAGRAVIEAAGDECPPTTPEGEDLETAEERLDAKIEDARRQRDAAADGETGAGSTEERLERLEGRSRQSEADRATGDAFERGENGGPGRFPDKPW